jgi:hypothetical protein
LNHVLIDEDVLTIIKRRGTWVKNHNIDHK